MMMMVGGVMGMNVWVQVCILPVLVGCKGC